MPELEWRAALGALHAKEKSHTRAQDALAAERRRQLPLYHFMFHPDWDEGCVGCSMLVDDIGHPAHLHARDGDRVFRSYVTDRRGVEHLGSNRSYLDLPPRPARNLGRHPDRPPADAGLRVVAATRPLPRRRREGVGAALMPRIRPHLWFDDQAEAAAGFYTSIFANSRIGGAASDGDTGGDVSGRPEGSVMTVEFELYVAALEKAKRGAA